jgi:hypothetical protein
MFNVSEEKCQKGAMGGSADGLTPFDARVIICILVQDQSLLIRGEALPQIKISSLVNTQRIWQDSDPGILQASKSTILQDFTSKPLGTPEEQPGLSQRYSQPHSTPPHSIIAHPIPTYLTIAKTLPLRLTLSRPDPCSPPPTPLASNPT